MEADHSRLQKSVSKRNVTIKEARIELNRLQSDPLFNCTDRNRRFLEYVSNELFAGRQEAIKSYVIAVDVFGRPTSFDPVTDPIVRVEANRLRASLSHYYEVNNSRSNLIIELPKGRYIPSFKRRQSSSAISPLVESNRLSSGAELPVLTIQDPNASSQSLDMVGDAFDDVVRSLMVLAAEINRLRNLSQD